MSAYGKRNGAWQPTRGLAFLNFIKFNYHRAPAASGALVLISCLLLAASGVQSQQDFQTQDKSTSNAGERPRLIPIVVSDSGYSENSSVNILCTVSQGHHESLTFDWFKDGHLLAGPGLGDEPSQLLGGQAMPQIEKHQDHSLLRIGRVQSINAGRYTCSAKNQFGADSSSVNLVVNGN